MLNERTVRVDGLDLRVCEHGEGGRPFLAVHGYTGAKEDFTEWLDPLSDRGWHAACFDIRGHGASDRAAAEDGYSLERLAVDVLGVADALGWDDFVLLGHSMGGMIAQMVALDSAARLNGLILMATGHGPVGGIDPELVELAMGVAVERGMDALADLLAAIESPLDTDAHRRLLAEREGYAEYGDRNLRSTDAAAYVALGREMLTAPDRLDQLRSLAVPALVIGGQQDHTFVDACRSLAAAIPGARLAELVDAGHSPQFEQPHAWWAEVSGFLDSL